MSAKRPDALNSRDTAPFRFDPTKNGEIFIEILLTVFCLPAKSWKEATSLKSNLET